MFERFFWWIQNDANAPVVLLQSVLSVLMVGITGVLCRVTYRYMVLTRELATTARTQLQESVRPVIAVRLSFGGAQNSYGEDVFRDRADITVTNDGTVPMVIQKVVLGWDHCGDGNLVQKEVPGFRHVLVNPGNKHFEEQQMLVDNVAPSVEHLDSWSDFVSVSVECSDLGRAAPVSYIYQHATGLQVQ